MVYVVKQLPRRLLFAGSVLTADADKPRMIVTTAANIACMITISNDVSK